MKDKDRIKPRARGCGVWGYQVFKFLIDIESHPPSKK